MEIECDGGLGVGELLARGATRPLYVALLTSPPQPSFGSQLKVGNHWDKVLERVSVSAILQTTFV